MQRAKSAIEPYAVTLAMTLASLAFGLALQRAHVGVANTALVFLTAVFVSAVRYGLRPALFACVISLLLYNFFFLPPLYTFVIADPGNIVALFFFGLVAVVTSNLAARVRAQGLAARERAAMMESLYLFSRKLAEVYTLDDLLWAICYQIAQMLKVRVILLLPNDRIIAVRAGYPPDDTLDAEDLTAAHWTWTNGQSAGRDSTNRPGAKRMFVPLRTGRTTVGVVGLDSDLPGPLLTPDRQRLFESLADQSALAIERLNLSEDIERTRLSVETERLRSAMLTSLSHDLRTPLASILGSASSLRLHRKSLDDVAQTELIATIQEEAERLHRFIVNLLDMTRLESGAIEPNLDFVDLSDVLGSALHRAEEILAAHIIEIDIPPELPLVRLDPVLFEQVLFNLLDNAAKYTPTGTRILLRAREHAVSLCLEIADEGPGIPEGHAERIFDKFYRVQATDHKRAGTGLGLAICRGFVEAMGGTITAENRNGERGANFVITLPVTLVQERAA